ncbi:hypothetical protein Taro_023800 [Colocasia esculenta]|uniref:Retrotransposon gag domain-containing protein n=1 Tax=Colocasia esculenta TaxID=4460 RepID=A0A843V9F6_COLES|nr:hypothetical protein [Colocasia esculenta]
MWIDRASLSVALYGTTLLRVVTRPLGSGVGRVFTWLTGAGGVSDDLAKAGALGIRLAPDGPAGRALLTESLHRKVMRARKTKSSGASNGYGGKSERGRARRPRTTFFNCSRTTIMEAPLVARQLEDRDRKLPAISATKSVNGNLRRTPEHDFYPLIVNRTDGATIKGGGISHTRGRQFLMQKTLSFYLAESDLSVGVLPHRGYSVVLQRQQVVAVQGGVAGRSNIPELGLGGAEAVGDRAAPPTTSVSHVNIQAAVPEVSAPALQAPATISVAPAVATDHGTTKATEVDHDTAESTPVATSILPAEPRWRSDIQEMNRKIEALQRGTRVPSVTTLLSTLPFTEEITSAQVPMKLQLPKFRRYNGTSNPVHHLDDFQGQVEMVNLSDALKCRAFMPTVDDAALQWFKTLPARSVTNFHYFAQQFLYHFFNTVQHSLCTDDLWHVAQRSGELFRDYAKRFQLEAMKVIDLDLQTAVNILTRVYTNTPFISSVAKKPPVSLSYLLSRMQKYARLESTLGAAGKLGRSSESGSSRKGSEPKKPRRDEPSSRGDRRSGSNRQHDEYRRTWDLPSFTRLPFEILPIIKRLPEFRRPEPLPRPPPGHGADQYCEYHKGYGHITDQCRSLKMEISNMLRRGIIGKDVVDRRTKERTPEEERGARGGKGAVHVLAGGLAGGGDSGRKWKAYASAVGSSSGGSAPRPHGVITFFEDDIVGLSFPHDDALVVSADIDGYSVHRILVDSGVAPDVLFYDCYVKMTDLNTELKPIATPLFEFSGSSVSVEGSIKLKVTLKTRPCLVTVEADFLVVKVKSTYNVILGRGILGKLGGVPSTYHQKLKFPTPSGIGEVAGNQIEARVYRFCHGSVDTPIDGVDIETESLKVFHEDRVKCVDTALGSVDTSPRFQKTQLPDWDSVSTQPKTQLPDWDSVSTQPVSVSTLVPSPRRLVLCNWDSVSTHSVTVSTHSG